jgi:hypothetical protein
VLVILDEALRQSEVHDVQDVCILVHSHQEVVWFNIPVQDVLLVEQLDAV